MPRRRSKYKLRSTHYKRPRAHDSAYREKRKGRDWKIRMVGKKYGVYSKPK